MVVIRVKPVKHKIMREKTIIDVIRNKDADKMTDWTVPMMKLALEIFPRSEEQRPKRKQSKTPKNRLFSYGSLAIRTFRTIPICVDISFCCCALCVAHLTSSDHNTCCDGVDGVDGVETKFICGWYYCLMHLRSALNRPLNCQKRQKRAFHPSHSISIK